MKIDSFSKINLKLTKETLLSIISISYIFCAILFHFPQLRNPQSIIFKVWNFLGLQQRWNLFAPSIPIDTCHIIGITTLQSGTKILWEPPHPSNHQILERNCFNRFLKWEADYLPWKIYGPQWQKLCEHVGLEFTINTTKPYSTTLIREWAFLGDPSNRKNFSNEKMPFLLREDTPYPWQHEQVFYHCYRLGE